MTIRAVLIVVFGGLTCAALGAAAALWWVCRALEEVVR